MEGSQPLSMLMQGVDQSLFEAYDYWRSDEELLRRFGSFPIFNPDNPLSLLVPDCILYKRHSDSFIDFGAECSAMQNPTIAFDCFPKEADFSARWIRVETYRSFPTLQQYIAVVSGNRNYVEQHTRAGDSWDLRVLRENDEIDLIDGRRMKIHTIFHSWDQ